MQNYGTKCLNFSKEFITLLFSEKSLDNAISLCVEDIAIILNNKELFSEEKNIHDVLIFLKNSFLSISKSLQFINASYSFLTQDVCSVFLTYYFSENYFLTINVIWKRVGEEYKICHINFCYEEKLQYKELLFSEISPRLQSLYSGMQAGIVRCDYETMTVHEATDFFYKKFNFSQDELKSVYQNNLLNLVCDQDRETLKNLIQNLQIGKSFEFVTKFLIRNVSVFVFLNGELIEKNGKKYLDILITNSALIKRKKEKLQQATDEINFIYNNIPSVIFRCSFSKEGIVSFANKAFYDFIGYNEEEFLTLYNNSFNKIMLLEDSAYVWNTISKNLTQNDKKTILIEFRMVTKGNIIKHLVVRIRLMYNEEGVPSLYCVGYDKTEIYHYEEDLQKAKQKLEIAVSHLNISYWEYDPITGKAHITRFENGKPRHEIIENFVDFVIKKNIVDPEYFEVFKELHESLKTGVSYAEANILLSQGVQEERVWKKFRYSTIFDNNNKPMLCIGTSEDINAYMEIKNKLAIATKQTGIIIWTYNIKTKELSIENDNPTNLFIKNNEENTPEKRIAGGKIFYEDIEKYRNFYKSIEDGIPSGSCEVRVFDFRTGGYIWVKLNYSLMLDYKNEPNFALGTIVDVSEIKKAEEQYKEQVQLWEVAQQNTFGSLVFNVDTKKILKSRIGNLTDVAVDDIDAELLRFGQFILKQDQKEEYVKMVDLQNIAANFENGISSLSCTFQGRFFNQPMWLECEMQVMRHYESGNLLAFLSLKDITHSVVKSSFAELCVLYQIDFILQIDLKTDTYILWNEHIELQKEVLDQLDGLYSYDAPRILSYYAVEEDKDRIIYEMSLSKLVSRAVESANGFEIGFRCIRFSGDQEEIRYKRFHVFMYDEESETICVGCMDITELYLEEQRRNDELYQALEATRQANKTKSRFLASMSHDLRTPMNGIIGMTNIALANLDDKKQVQESLEIIKSSSDHLLNLLNDILEMAKIESGKMSHVKALFSIVDVTQKTCDIFKGAIKQKNIHFKFYVEKITHNFVEGDETRYQRIIANIIGNAIKFTPQNGSVSVTLKEITILRNNITQFVILVEDTGIGIPAEQLPYIFDPFHRVESSMISKIEGTGLGLAIVKALVDGLGGIIKVDSELGKGSTFTLELPFAVENKKFTLEDMPSIENEENIYFENISALLVEDHPINIVVIKKILESLGMKITVKQNGKEGVDTFLCSENNTFDIIFMDLQMPVMNGYEATISIRQSKHLRAKTIPIVAMTANTFEEDIKKCFEVGMNGHIAKPIVRENLVKTLITLGIRYCYKEKRK